MATPARDVARRSQPQRNCVLRTFPRDKYSVPGVARRHRSHCPNGRRFGEDWFGVNGFGTIFKGADEQSSRKGARTGNGPGALLFGTLTARVGR